NHDSFHGSDPIAEYRKNIANIPENYQINTKQLPQKYRSQKTCHTAVLWDDQAASACSRPITRVPLVGSAVIDKKMSASPAGTSETLAYHRVPAGEEACIDDN